MAVTTLGTDLRKQTYEERKIVENFRQCQPTSGAWATWNPTVTVSGGGGTFGTIVSTTYKYRTNSPEIRYMLAFSGTVAGVVTQIKLTHPSGIVIPAINYNTVCQLSWGGGNAIGLVQVNDTGIFVRETNNSNFPVGAGTGLLLTIVAAELS